MSEQVSDPVAQLRALPAEVRGRLSELRDAVVQAGGDALVCILVFGSAACGDWVQGRSDIDWLLVLREDDRATLTRVGHPLLLARYSLRIESLILREDQIGPSVDVFPLLYDDVRETAVAIYGTSPFVGLTISDRHRGLRVEQELREARIRLRRMVSELDGTPRSLAMAVGRKLRQVRAPLRALLRLRGADPGYDLGLVLKAIARVYELDLSALGRVHEAPSEAHDTFTLMLDRAIADVDARNREPEVET